MGVPSLQRRRPYKERKRHSAREEAAGRGQSDAATSPAGQGLAEAGRRLPRARAGGPASTLTSDLQPAALGESKLLLQQATQLAGLVGSQRRGPAPVGVSGPPASWAPLPACWAARGSGFSVSSEPSCTERNAKLSAPVSGSH